MMNINLAQDSTSALETGNEIEATGEFFPSGPPQKKPERIEAGKYCIVDLIEPYTISGTLSGAIKFNYRSWLKDLADHLPERLMKSGLLMENSNCFGL